MNYTVLNKQYFGYLPQLATFDELACTPTSATNALTYIVSQPGFAGGAYAPLSSYSGWESVRDDIATNYFYTSPNSIPPGTLPALAVIGMNQYLVDNGLKDHVSISAIGVSTDPQGNNIAGWNTPAQHGIPAVGPASQYSQLFTEQRVTGEFLRASLLRSDAILAGGFYATGDGSPEGHAVLITDLKWTDKNVNGLIDSEDGATVTILDPLDPSQNYSPVVGSYIGFGAGFTDQERLADALNTKVTATGEALFKTGSIIQNEAGALVVQYDQTSLVNNNGTFENSGGDSSNGRTEATDMTFMLAMSLGANGLPDSVDHLIEKDMPVGTFVFDVSVFGGNKVEGYIYTNEESAYQNTLQFYLIEAPDGSISDPDTGKTLVPGDEGYAALALQLATELSALDMEDRISQDAEQLHAFQKEISSDEGNSVLFAPVVTTSAGDSWFAFELANKDQFNHFKALAPNTYGVEDMFGGGDGDFNDLVFQLIPTRMEELPSGDVYF